jgi:hypothetical protein
MGRFHGNQHTNDGCGEYSYGKLVTGVKRLADELERPPTTRDAQADARLPSLQKLYELSEDGWLGVLDDADLERTQVGKYGVRERPKMCADLQRALDAAGGSYLTHREYDEFGRYSTSVVKEYFGSWKEACEAAALSPGQKYGVRCEGPLGESLDSWHERSTARLLNAHGIEYTVHPQVEDTNWEGDFYLPKAELWIEVDGFAAGGRPNQSSFEAKLDYYQTHGLNFVVGDPDQLEKVLRDRSVLPP